MDYVTFNGVANAKIICPNDLQMAREPNIVAEITTMSGKQIADVNGWRYSDTTLHWDYLPDEDLKKVLEQTDPIVKGVFDFGFLDITDSSSRKAIKAFRRGMVTTKTRFRDSAGNVVWKDVELSLTFPDIYR